MNQPITASPLTLPESMKLGQLELIVQRGLDNFVVVGKALTEIHDQKLYREKYATWEDYMQRKWGLSCRRGYELMKAAEVVQSLPENVRNSAQITNEAQANELSKVPAASRPAVLEKAAASGPVTAKAIREAASEVVEQEEPEEPPQEEAAEPEHEPDTLHYLKIAWEEGCAENWKHASKSVKREFDQWKNRE